MALLFALSFVDCAKRGSPSGGERDSLPPVIVRSVPENYTTNFEGDEIRIYFDEYIKLVDVQTNLIVSPPLEYQPIITPLNTSKQLRVKILDTLRENTTYSFNFGKSIVDNNEENEFPYFKYVFSTGSYIDSLRLNGAVKDALLPEAKNPVVVSLYELNENYTDSLLFSKKPMYITTTTDSTGTFQFTNLKEGKYLLTALKEKTNDYTFQPKTDKIGFVMDTVTLPTDTTYTLTLFKEQLDYNMTRPTHVSKNQFLFGFEGNIDSLQLEPLSSVPEGYESTMYRDAKKDTIQYWFKPAFDHEVTDSLLFLAKNRLAIDTLEVRVKDLYADSLKVSSVKSGTLTPKDTFQLQFNTPLVSIDKNLIQVMDKDSAAVEIKTQKDSVYNRAKLLFEKNTDQRYFITALPGAFTDFFEETNDTLTYNFKTKAEDDYGTIALSLQNANDFPYIIELVNSKYEIVASTWVSENQTVDFTFIDPGFYYIRIIFDANENQRWDTGNFLKRIQPERIVYYPKKIEVRANWSLQETFILK
ncbi:Ig-like domain-containing protein [Marinirhabdus gelatinilytica]|uniref:Ig-like domain-containing protein n=2 Tax=Marinirhabdus gelatinilytica TaxID=1703343 RepID=A0A370QIL5_9FLAO|nr:Ig-like domain-containing protein [Marinirhabdus gelatinilytica]